MSKIKTYLAPKTQKQEFDKHMFTMRYLTYDYWLDEKLDSDLHVGLIKQF